MAVQSAVQIAMSSVHHGRLATHTWHSHLVDSFEIFASDIEITLETDGQVQTIRRARSSPLMRDFAPASSGF
jgi:hypothetical protein